MLFVKKTVSATSIGIIYAVAIFLVLKLFNQEIFPGLIPINFLSIIVILFISGLWTEYIGEFTSLKDLFLILALMSFISSAFFALYQADFLNITFPILLILYFIIFFVLSLSGSVIGGFLAFLLMNRNNENFLDQMIFFKPSIKKLIIFLFLFIPGLYISFSASVENPKLITSFNEEIFIIAWIIFAIIDYFFSCTISSYFVFDKYRKSWRKHHDK